MLVALALIGHGARRGSLRLGGVAGLRFDAQDLRQWSADGIPTLVELLPTLPEQQRTDLVIRVLGHRSPPEHVDWRSWSLGRYQASQAVAGYEATIGMSVGLPAPSR